MTKWENKNTFILKTFLVFSVKVVLFFKFCYSMMVKLGSELLYQEYFYKIHIWHLGSEVRQQIDIAHIGKAYYSEIWIYAPIARLKGFPRYWA